MLKLRAAEKEQEKTTRDQEISNVQVRSAFSVLGCPRTQENDALYQIHLVNAHAHYFAYAPILALPEKSGSHVLAFFRVLSKSDASTAVLGPGW